MAFQRLTVPNIRSGDELTHAMVGIGMLFAAKETRNPNVEDTILSASIEGMLRKDFRVLAILTTWLGVHHPAVNVDRLYRALRTQPHPRLYAYWSAIAKWLSADRRFARIENLYDGPRIEPHATGSDFLIRRRGEDPRFLDSPILVAAGSLRDRRRDVADPAWLVRRHRAYRCRVLMGPSYRADMWAELEGDPTLSAAELARRTYGSFATAWNVKKDWALLHAA
ncbi:hypothetical protein K8I61_06440 [bacterium]|nr:hypothetical protein [bacterium]